MTPISSRKALRAGVIVRIDIDRDHREVRRRRVRPRSRSRVGISARQGTHHVAQRLRRTVLPAKVADAGVAVVRRLEGRGRSRDPAVWATRKAATSPRASGAISRAAATAPAQSTAACAAVAIARPLTYTATAPATMPATAATPSSRQSAPHPWPSRPPSPDSRRFEVR